MRLNWLNGNPNYRTGVSWGVPWKRGEVSDERNLVLTNSTGLQEKVQSWPLAYWPDGSIKWSGHAATLSPESNFYQIKMGEPIKSDGLVEIDDQGDHIQVNTGGLICKINKKGKYLIESLIKSSVKKMNGKLVGLVEKRSKNAENEWCYRHIELESKIKSAMVEQEGSLRSVIKIDGVLKEKTSGNECFPFEVRMYFYSGLDSIRIMHTFIYDGNPETDFIRGLGMRFSLPLRGELWNRNIRFYCDEGLYSEASQLLSTRMYSDGNGHYKRQIRGEAVSLDVEKDESMIKNVKDNAIWNDYKVIQDSANHYKVKKRTSENCSWVHVTSGKRAKGTIYTGDENGGLAIGLRNFWQKNPSSLEVTGLGKDTANMTVWLWSLDGETMDMRHYDDVTHVESAYEGFEELRATPFGVANTSEINLRIFSYAPPHQELEEFNETSNFTPLLVCDPEYYYSTQALGVWSLPDKQDPMKKRLEEQLENALAFYQNEIEQRSWYGYWNYGDVMHTYDPIRHQWRYDLGGYAWQNSELVPNIWLWYSFLRSGKKDVFQMAEAMTRHTSEVDRYHLGEYAGLGSRHNVVHWGCGCKEVRISMAGLHKYYYFLTTDERTRDLLEDVRDADTKTELLDPMRAYFPKGKYPTHVRVGPDWAAFVSNWISEWERTQNDEYRKYIITGLNDVKKMPFRILSGPTHEYDPSTKKLYHISDGNSGDAGGYHMVISFGAPQIWMELANLLNDEDLKDMMAEFGEFYLLSDDEKRKRTNGKISDDIFRRPMFAVGMIAYAAQRKKDKELARKAWNLLLDKENIEVPYPFEIEKVRSWRDLNEFPIVSTNIVSQWCINTIVALELIGDSIPNIK